MRSHWPRIAVFIGVFMLLTSIAVAGHAQQSPAPRVWSIVSSASTNDTVIFTVTFSEAVRGVDISDFRISDTHRASITQVNANENANTYDVHISYMNQPNEIILMLIDDDSIVNDANIPLGHTGSQNGNAISHAFIPSQESAVSQSRTQAIQRLPRISGADLGAYNALALTTANVPIMSYYDYTNYDLKLAICNNPSCEFYTTQKVDSTANVGMYSDIVVTSTNLPIISYFDFMNFDLKLAVCNDTACTNPTLSTIDSAGGVGQYTSIALTTNDIPIISYYDASNSSLKIAICNTTACTSPRLVTVDNTGDVGVLSSIALTSTNIPVISYNDSANNDLKLATCDDIICANPSIRILDTNDVMSVKSMALTSQDIPVISYFDGANNDLKLAVCDDVACEHPTLTTIDSDGIAGMANALALTTTDIPIISYNADSLKLAVCNNLACATPKISTLDQSFGAGEHVSIALTSTDVPIISYYDGIYRDLLLYRGIIAIDQDQPNAFGKSTPANTATVTNNASVTLTWNSIENTTSYEYCFALTANTCTNWSNVGTSTNVTKFNLTHNTTYYWQVRANNESGTTVANGGTMWQFTVVLPPTSFAKSLPANNAKNQKTTVTLSWAASTRATSYEYCIALSTTSCTNWKSTGANRTATVTGLTKNKSYYWQVRAKNAGGTTLSTTTFWKFTTAR